MDNEQKLLELLEQIEKNNRRHIRYARIQIVFTFVMVALCFALLLCGMKVIPQLEDTIEQVEIVLTNLETVTNELSGSEISGMVENMDSLVKNVDELVETSRSGVEKALENLNSIDFKALNNAIKDLSDVIDPIAKFFKSFKFG